MSKRKVKKHQLFNPDQIATAISQQFLRDLDHKCMSHFVDPRPAKFYLEAQRNAVLKKYQTSSEDTQRLEEEAYFGFLIRNNILAGYGFEPLPNGYVDLRRVSVLQRCLFRAKALIAQVLGDLATDEIYCNTRHSSGVTLGVPFMDTSIESKFQFPLSTTERVIPLFNDYLCFDSMLKRHLFGDANPLNRDWYDVRNGSRATTVPKTDDKRRMIAIEPTLNMFFQQGLAAVMTSRLRDVGLDVECLPQIHRILAMESSVSGRNATIDFSNASDSVSIELLKVLLPPKWFEWIDLVRSPIMQVGDTDLRLSMTSTMGNAVTFPLETLIFWSLAVSSVMESKTDLSNPHYGVSRFSTPSERQSCSVFGDDCILPTESAELFIELMSKVGFKVNEEKSFFDVGPGFRESCGGDYYHMRGVRPFCIKGPSSTKKAGIEAWMYIMLNRATEKYISYFGTTSYVYNKGLYAYIFSWFKENGTLVKFVPPDYPDDSGFKSLDIWRFISCYELDISPIARNEHGSFRFSFLTYKYQERRKVDLGLRYVDWLKNPSLTDVTLTDANRTSLPGDRTNPIRIRGHYLVAKGRSPFWRLPIKNNTTE